MKVYSKLSAVVILGVSLTVFFIASRNSCAVDKKAGSEMLAPWGGPYGGVPPWHLVQPNSFVSAFDQAIKLSSQDIDAIANNPEPATFENTIIAMEKAGESLSRLQALFGVHQSNLKLGPIPDIELVVEPKLTAHWDSIIQNKALFDRIAAVQNGEEATKLDLAQKRLLDKRYREFVRSGAQLSEEAKATLSKFNSRLTSLQTTFAQNLLSDEQSYVTWIEDEADLAGLSASLRSSMAKAAKDHGKPGKWAVKNTRSAMDPFLTYSSNRGLREKVWRTYYNRGDNGGEHDNNGIISEILSIRAKRAKLLGYETHAHWKLAPQMAKTPQKTMDLMLKVWPKAVARVAEEVRDMQAIADKERANITIEGWDYRYYAEKVRKDKYDLDFNLVKPYLQLEKLVEGMMWVSKELFGLSFTRIHDVPVFHPDVRTYKVTNPDGKLVGLWYLDPYARDGKSSGAWMTSYREQKNLDGWITPIVSNNSNFLKSGDGKPVLISWDDATTLFHEFGHALHGLLSNVTYPSQSGTSVATDYVEFPSQLLEHWLMTDAVLNRFAVHYENGEVLKPELLEKIKLASKFNTGFGTVEYLASALIDMKLHLAGDVAIDPDAFERKTLAELNMPKEIVMRHRTPQFAHIFATGAYSAGYYSYLWADTLTADAAELFEEKGSYYHKESAKSLHDNILSVGDTIDPAVGFRQFRGRDVDIKALLRKRGFPIN